MNSGNSKGVRTLVWVAVIALIILHQDFWFWDTYEPLVFGFMPIGLAYHVGLSIAASVVWYLATRFCFPVQDESPAASAATEGEGQ